MSSRPNHVIVIVGGGVAGISLTHHVLRHVVPTLTSESAIQYTVKLVCASSHFYWKVGAPRALVNSELIPLTESFIPLSEGFKEYDSKMFKLVIGSATSIDESTKIVRIDTKAADSLSIHYDSLMIATGMVSNSPLFSLRGSHEITQSALKKIHTQLPAAKSVVIVGGGPTGVETAGEIAAEYGKQEKKITLISGCSRLLPRLKPSTSSLAETKLTTLGVEILHDVRVESAPELTSEKDITKISLTDGRQLTADVYINATGGAPSTGFLPQRWLDEKSYVITNPNTLRVEVPGVTNVYSLGAVTSFTNGSYFDAVETVRPLAESFRIDQVKAAMERGTYVPKTGWMSWIWPFDPLRPKFQYNQKTSSTQFVPCGRDGGVGELFDWGAPNRMVYKIKAKSFMIERAKPIVRGDDFK